MQSFTTRLSRAPRSGRRSDVPAIVRATIFSVPREGIDSLGLGASAGNFLGAKRAVEIFERVNRVLFVIQFSAEAN